MRHEGAGALLGGHGWIEAQVQHRRSIRRDFGRARLLRVRGAGQSEQDRKA
jgi:hypothetical protein